MREAAYSEQYGGCTTARVQAFVIDPLLQEDTDSRIAKDDPAKFYYRKTLKSDLFKGSRRERTAKHLGFKKDIFFFFFLDFLLLFMCL